MRPKMEGQLTPCEAPFTTSLARQCRGALNIFSKPVWVLRRWSVPADIAAGDCTGISVVSQNLVKLRCVVLAESLFPAWDESNEARHTRAQIAEKLAKLRECRLRRDSILHVYGLFPIEASEQCCKVHFVVLLLLHHAVSPAKSAMA